MLAASRGEVDGGEWRTDDDQKRERETEEYARAREGRNRRRMRTERDTLIRVKG